MRQLTDPDLFKINMNLEMEKGTEAARAAVERLRRASWRHSPTMPPTSP
jgi:hypothetical protein